MLKQFVSAIGIAKTLNDRFVLVLLPPAHRCCCYLSGLPIPRPTFLKLRAVRIRTKRLLHKRLVEKLADAAKDL